MVAWAVLLAVVFQLATTACNKNKMPSTKKTRSLTYPTISTIRTPVGTPKSGGEKRTTIILTKDLPKKERRTEPMGKTPRSNENMASVPLAKSEEDPDTLKDIKSLAPDPSNSLK